MTRASLTLVVVACTQMHATAVSLPTAGVSLILDGGSRGVIRHLSAIQRQGDRTRVALHQTLSANTQTHSPKVSLPTAAVSLLLNGGSCGVMTKNRVVLPGDASPATARQPIIFVVT